MKNSVSTWIWMLPAIVILGSSCQSPAAPARTFEELTIAQIHEAFREGTLTSEALTAYYLDRIAALDQSTGINAIVVVNPSAMEDARQRDEAFKRSGELLPLHGIPVIVKDNYLTKGLQTTAGSIALKGFEPAENATQVQQLLDAGAIVLAKSNMAEWAFSPMHTESSIAGTTRNPYNIEHVPAGSSGGTAAAVAANFGAVGLGTDTGNSIRGPSSHNSLVGFRSTLGLTSRHGIAPLYLRNDVGGPMCRTVEDAARILQVIAGVDPLDTLTRYAEGKIPDNYLDFLQKDGLQGARIGVMRQLSDKNPDSEVSALFEQALQDMIAQGAVLVDPFVVPRLDTLRQDQWCADFGQDIAVFLQTFVKRPGVSSIEDILAIGGTSPFVTGRLERFVGRSGRWEQGDIPCGDPYTDVLRIAYREAIEQAMDALELDALVYPSWNHPPAKVSAFEEGYKGDNSQLIAPHTGQPAFTVPMGFTTGNLPAGIQFLGRSFSEPVLIKLAYAYEQATRHRRPPVLP
jgi:amidase